MSAKEEKRKMQLLSHLCSVIFALTRNASTLGVQKMPDL
jgi:hypothetical protein